MLEVGRKVPSMNHALGTDTMRVPSMNHALGTDTMRVTSMNHALEGHDEHDGDIAGHRYGGGARK